MLSTGAPPQVLDGIPDLPIHAARFANLIAQGSGKDRPALGARVTHIFLANFKPSARQLMEIRSELVDVVEEADAVHAVKIPNRGIDVLGGELLSRFAVEIARIGRSQLPCSLMKAPPR